MTYENDWYRALNVYYDVEKMQPFGDTQRIAYEPRGGATRAIPDADGLEHRCSVKNRMKRVNQRASIQAKDLPPLVR
jgi:hypothetical protein